MPRVTAYGGVGEIGGNRILVETDVRIFLDFGTSFSVQKRFFHEYLKPRKVSGLQDYFRTGLAPEFPGLYRSDLLQQMGRKEEAKSVDAVVLSHPHIDHVGLVPLLRHDVPLVMAPASRAVLRMLEITGSSSTLSDFLTYGDLFGLRPGVKDPERLMRAEGRFRPTRTRPVVDGERAEFGETKVSAWSVDHSIPGARGTLVESRDLHLAYTGDLRFHGRRRSETEKFLDHAQGVDVLVTEGTNLGREDKSSEAPDDEATTKYTPEPEIAKVLAEKIAAAPDFCFVNYPARDLDRLLSFYEAARQTGRRLLLTTKQAVLLDEFRKEGLDVPRLGEAHLGVYLQRKGYGVVDRPEVVARDPKLLVEDYEGYERPYLDADHSFTAADVRKEPGKFLVYIDLYNATELVDLDPKEGTYVFSKTEPFDAEMRIDQERLENWLQHFHLRLEKAHASGHAPPDDLWHIIDRLEPRRILPIHTMNVRAFEDRYKHKVTRVEAQKAVTV